MFYGLNKFIKNLLPKQLFYRALLIVAAPIIILQITISIVFFDSLWIKTNKGMTRALVGEIKTFINAYENEEYNKKLLTSLFKENLEFQCKVYSFKTIYPSKNSKDGLALLIERLRRELKSKNLNYWFDTTSFKNLIDLKIRVFKWLFSILYSKRKNN